MDARRIGFKKVLTIGALAYFARYLIWSFGDLPTSVIVGSQALHGVCYACFFATAFIYVDRLAAVDIRHSAQTVFGILILGGGPILGGLLSGKVEAWSKHDEIVNYDKFWMVLSAIGLIVAIGLFATFKNETSSDGNSGKSNV